MFKYLRSAFSLKREVNTCHEVENIQAEYREEMVTIQKPLVQIPVTETVKMEVITKEAAIEQYYECDPETGKVRICTKEIPAETEVIEYTIIKGYETVQEASVLQIKVQKRVSDGGIVEHC